ncbi:MAG: FtsW/RodA/SpoVE family cell cycle protein [Mycoplasmatales bacterium]
MRKLLNLKLNLPLIIIFLFLGSISLITLKNINPLLSENIMYINFFKKQLVGFSLGLIAIFIIFNVNLKKVIKLINFFYFTLVIMLLILAVNPPIIGDFFVNSANGANGWFKLFSPRISFQPVEFFKIFLILKLAMISKIHLSNNTKDRYLLQNYVLYGYLPIFLVLKEPDLGGTVLLGFAAFMMMLCSLKNSKNVKRFLILIIVIILLATLLIFSTTFREIIVKITPIQSYQLERIDSWTDPFTTDKGFQLSQSLMLMGSSGLFGHGAGYDLLTIPEAQTDLIFVSAVAFWGVIVGILIIFSYLLMLLQFFKIALYQKDIFYKFIMIGISSLFFLQVFENIGMMIGLLPITGIVLPFMSYGVSALLTYCVLLGLALNISKETIFQKKNYLGE